MSTSNRQAQFNFEDSVARLHLTPAQRRETLAAAHTAEVLVTTIQRIGAAFKRLSESLVLKPRVRA
jgi:hypothetical protein